MSAQEYRLIGTHRERELSFTLETELIIGRKVDGGAQVDIDLQRDQSVSRQHARIWVQDGRCWIEDLGSFGGTMVGSQEIRDHERVELLPGVPVVIGKAELRLVAPTSPALATALIAEVRCLTSFNYSLAHGDVPFLESLTLTNKGSESLTILELQVTVIPYAESERIRVACIPAAGSHKVASMRFRYDRQRLLHLVEPVTVPVEVLVDGRPLTLAAPVSVQVLPLRAWHCVGHEPVLAAFVVKGFDAVQEIIGRARATLRSEARGCSSFEDVLERHPDPVTTIARILYDCLQERYEIAYGREPRYYGKEWQIIRLPADMLDPRTLEGTCIDLAGNLAACMEHRWLSPVIVLVKTGIDAEGYSRQHALVGCWTVSSPRWNTADPTDPVERDGQLVADWVDSGELLLLDPVGYARGKGADQGFNKSRRSARRYLDRALTGYRGYAFRYAVDIEVARFYGIEPLPFGAEIEFDRDAWLVISRARREATLRGSAAVGGRHLLLGLLSLPDGVLAQALCRLHKDLPEKVANQARTTLGNLVSTRTRSPWRTTPDWDAAIAAARQRAKAEGRLLVGEADLAVALLGSSARIGEIMRTTGVTPEQLQEEIRSVLSSRRGPSRWHSSGMGT
jgi:hypothetical protein